jgi:hypothetical protein
LVLGRARRESQPVLDLHLPTDGPTALQSKSLEADPAKRHDKFITWVETNPNSKDEMLTASAGPFKAPHPGPASMD